MATQKTGQSDKPKSSTVGDKVLEIIRSFTGTGGEEPNDPVHKEIKRMSDESPIGGGKRRRKIDDELEKSGG